MTDIPLQSSALVALSPAALHRLRDTAGAQVLQESGYAASDESLKDGVDRLVREWKRLEGERQ